LADALEAPPLPGGESRMQHTMRARSFANQVVWITGASSGIGRALAMAYHDAGARLIVSARRTRLLDDVRRACGNDPDVHVLPMDLSHLAALPGKVNEAVAIYGHVDCLVHNAAVAVRDRVVDTELAVHQHIMATNYFGPVALTRAILPSMLARRSGHFVVMSSLAGTYGAPQMSAYAASKHALEGFFESLEAEVYEHNIRISVVVPGFIRTTILRSAMTGSGGSYARDLPAHERGMDPWVCARHILTGLAAGRRRIHVGGSEIASVYLKRFCPALLAWLVRHHPIRARQRWFGVGAGARP
jgi:dehydrogenase/reductase SDR family member 7B